jgi:lipid-A-disaccharide synthase
MSSQRSIFISAGEASGEQYGAALIDSLRRAFPESLRFFGLGGDQMRKQGCDLVVEARDVAVVGLVEVVRHLPRIYSRYRRLLRMIDERQPAVAVLIDFPDFNLRLARDLHKRGIPIIYFVSPQLWAWRKSRLALVQSFVRKMLVIFPFEEAFYRDHGVAAEYVGHPLADVPTPAGSRYAYAQQYGLDLSKPWIALLPGSRVGELRRHLGTMLEAASRLGNGFEFILPRASTITPLQVTRAIQIGQKTPLRVKVKVVDDARMALAQARAAIVASGTATVEAALVGNPFVVVYRVAPLTWKLGRKMVDLPNFAMVNLIAGKTIVPELIQHDFTADRVLKELVPLLADGAAREQMVRELATVREKLKPGTAPATDRAARAVVSALTAKPK